MTQSFRRAGRVDHGRAFTLIEVLVSMTVLVLLIGVIAQMTGGVASIVGRGGARIDTDAQARALLDRMAIDIGTMVKRPDVDYYLKGRPTTLTQGSAGQAVNDQIAFYSEVPGYFAPGTTTATESSVSLVAYRVNSTTMHLERLCKGMSWNGASTGNTMGFLPVPLASPLPLPYPSPTPTSFPAPLFPEAADPSATDPDYEELSPQIFRFEYYYVLKGQVSGSPAVISPSTLSIVPWYTAAPVSHTSVNGMQDVAAIGVLIAVIDPKSRALVSSTQLTTLAGQMEDAPDPTTATTFKSPGDIEASWLNAVNNSTLPKRATAAIRIYTRCFYLNGVSP